MNNASAYDYIQALYRFIFILSGSGSFAYQQVERNLQEAYFTADKHLERVRFQTLFSNASIQSKPSQASQIYRSRWFLCTGWLIWTEPH